MEQATFEDYIKEVVAKQREMVVPHKLEVKIHVTSAGYSLKVRPTNQEGAEFKEFAIEGNTLEPR